MELARQVRVRRVPKRSVAVLACAWLAGAAAVPALSAGTMQISDAWSRPTPPGTSVGAVYFSITNRGTAADRWLGASTPIASGAQMHQSSAVAGVMQMRAVPDFECPAGVTIKVAPGGLHLMLLGLRAPMTAGASFPLTLRFRDAGNVTVQVPVQTRE